LFNHFFGLRTQQEAWGLLPFDWQTSVRVALTDQLWLQSDLVLFSGAMNRNAFKNNTRTKGAADLNAGLSFRVNRSLQLWAQFNNLFNQPYQRWNQNPVFGFNCSGGIVFSFNEKKNP
jgi:outer membrane receptor for ferrienterochelin and colicin